MLFLRRFLLILLAALLPVVSQVWAQTEDPDFDQWARVAARAEQAIDTGRASEAAMRQLRDELVGWRKIFEDTQSRYRVSVTSLEAQLGALGPVPEGGEAESVAETRAELTRRLGEARAPILKAELAYTEAQQLIGGIDKLQRERYAVTFMERGPTPLNPAIWPHGLAEIYRSLSFMVGEVRTAWAYEFSQDDALQTLPEIVVLFGLAFLLMLRGRHWGMALYDYLMRSQPGAVQHVLLFCVSVLSELIPLLGVFVLVEALETTNLAGIRGGVFIAALPLAMFQLIAARWVGRQLFPRDDDEGAVGPLSTLQRAEGRTDFVVIGIMLALHTCLSELARLDNWAPEVRSVAMFGPAIITAVTMLRLSRLFGLMLKAEGGRRLEPSQYDGVLKTSLRFLQGVAILSVLLACIGYSRATIGLIYPAANTITLVVFLIFFHQFLCELFNLATGKDTSAGENSLAPVVIAGLLIVLALPLFLVIWGAEQRDINEMYARLGDGFEVGQILISPTQIIIFFVVFGVGYALTRFIQSVLKNSVLPKTRLDVGGQNAVQAGVGYVGITVAALIAIQNTGIDLGSIALLASALSVGIGFGLQTLVSNFVSGIILLIERPIAEGDWIEVGGQMGYVRDISVRSTRIETFDRTDVIVPNSDLVAGTVTNYTRGNTVGRVIVPVGVAYGTDPRLVEKILLDVANAHPMVLATPAPYVVFQGFGASSLDFEIRAILRDVNWVLSVRSDMNFAIAEKFAEYGIEIPFPQQDVWIRSAATQSPPLVEPVELDDPEIRSFQDNPPADNDGPDADGDGGDR